MIRHSSRFHDEDVLDCLRTDWVPSSVEAKRRISSRLSLSIASSLALTSASSPVFETSVPPRLSRLDAGRSWLARLARHRLAFAGAGFVMGAACGAAIHAALHHRDVAEGTPALAHTSAPAPIVKDENALTPVMPVPVDLPANPAPLDTPSVSGRVTPARPVTSGAANLGEQQALLDEARTALAQGDDVAALRALGMHARRYPNSIMTEEREALAIKALVGQRTYGEAKARGARFRERFPRSMLLPSIEDTLSNIP